MTAAVLFSAGGAQAHGIGDVLPLLNNTTLLRISYPSMDQARPGNTATRALRSAKGEKAGTITVNCNQQQQQQQQQQQGDPAAKKTTKVLKTVKDADGNTVINCNQQQQQQQQQQQGGK
ncbi:hypothetical protein ACFQ9Z_12405 [Streptomyces sp. NPDC056580]|uniref:hypothetical protein n=1 Tax=Streptomyces sp. NPDC056580 TaxID=3345872 RepID=UPI00368F1926